MFFSIQLETEPHSMRIKFGCFEKLLSHSVFKYPKKLVSFDAIQDISSKKMTS